MIGEEFSEQRWEVVVPVTELYLCVFRVLGGHFMLTDLEIKSFSSGFYTALRGRKPLTGCGRTWPGGGGRAMGDHQDGWPTESGCFQVISWPRKLVSSLVLSACLMSRTYRKGVPGLRTCSRVEVVELPLCLT